MANLLERNGDLAQAEDYFRKIDQRYESQDELSSFYLRNRARSPQYETAARAAIAKVFPNDLQQVKMSDLSTAPRDGVALAGTSRVTQRLGLRVGDVLVAIDGYRISNTAQYYMVRAFRTDPIVSYIVWQTDHYVEVKGNVPQRRIIATIADYKAP
jgi:hypothetical protein